MLLLFDLVGGTLCVYQAIFLEIYAFESTPVIVSCNNIPSSPPRAMFDVKTFFFTLFGENFPEFRLECSRGVLILCLAL